MTHYVDKFQTSVLEVWVTTTPAVLEDLTKLKLKELAGLPFIIRQKKFELWESESKAPGRDVAYILHAKEFLLAPPEDGPNGA